MTAPECVQRPAKGGRPAGPIHYLATEPAGLNLTLCGRRVVFQMQRKITDPERGECVRCRTNFVAGRQDAVKGRR